MTENRPLAQMQDRRQLGHPLRDIHLFEDRIEAWSESKLSARLSLDAIKEVRMAVEMAGQDRQIICDIQTATGQLTLGSLYPNGIRTWHNNAVDFRAFLLALHQALADQPQDIAYVEGQSLRLRLILTGTGLALAGLGLGFAAWVFAQHGWHWLSLIPLPFVTLGGMLAWSFRPNRPKPYDPKGLIENFKGQIERAQKSASDPEP